MIDVDKVAHHYFTVNEKDDSGEQLSIITKFYQYDDDPNDVYVNQEITLQSYSNSATFTLVGSPLLPAQLRQLADELEEIFNDLKGDVDKETP
jgi:hypothetical protein